MRSPVRRSPPIQRWPVVVDVLDRFDRRRDARRDHRRRAAADGVGVEELDLRAAGDHGLRALRLHAAAGEPIAA